MIIFAFFALTIIARYGFSRVMKYMLVGVCLFAMLCHQVNVHDPKVEAEHKTVATANAKGSSQ